MKKLKLFLILVFVWSCSSTNELEQKFLINGKWEFISRYGGFAGTISTKEDYSYSIYRKFYQNETVEILHNDTLKSSGKYELLDGQLILDEYGHKTEYKIVELTQTDLKFNFIGADGYNYVFRRVNW